MPDGRKCVGEKQKQENILFMNEFMDRGKIVLNG